MPERRYSRAVLRFSLPVLRCVDSVSLDTDGGAQSPYPAIAPHRVYRFVNGTFVEAEVPH
ncbi:hypothetical protein [Burkholderia metallica]|uniref:hypothetical protein n=1 Tax=Burkholderia metallica TaxID=488729 RepID=UPI00131D446A|nr:hypothetical protein [Burkholderia metallica]